MQVIQKANQSTAELKNRIAVLKKENASLKEELGRKNTPAASGSSLSDLDQDIHFLFFNTLKDFFWILDEQGNIIFVNDYVVNRLHYTRDELYNMNVLNVHPPERREEAFKTVTGMLAGTAEFCPIPVMSKEGQYIPVETRVVNGMWNNRQVIFGVSKDISALRLSEEKFSKAFSIDANLLAISEFDTGKYIDVNQRFLDTFRLTREDVIGKTSVEMNIFDQDIRKKIIEQMQDTGSLTDYEVELNYNGRHLWGLFSAKIFYIQQKKCLITSLKDITLRKQAEEKLRENQARLKTIIQTMPDLLFHLDKTGTFLSFYQENDQFLYKQPEEFLNKTVKDLFEEELAAKIMLAIGETISTGRFELFYDLQLAELRHFHAKLARLNRNEVIAIIRDITETKQAETRLQEYAAELNRLNMDKDRFMQILAHDMRSPFNSLIGMVDLLTEDLNPDSGNETGVILKSLSQTLVSTLDLLDDLLLWSKSQAGKLPFKPEQLVFSDLCKETISLIQQQATAKKIEIRLSDPDRITFFADRNMLKTILRNLVSNAVKFTNQHGLIIISAQKDGDSVLVTVSDNGIGMDRSRLAQLWNVAQPHTMAGTAGESGTGLGLLLCRDFVEKHGGAIRAESEPGKGSTFRFSLPV
ncbi:MAG: PAS domain S-box protein [Mangrovibacterium sp.]